MSSTAPPRREGRFAGAALRPQPDSRALVPPPTARPRSRRWTPVPDSLTNDAGLLSDMSALQANYSFELPKTIHRLREAGATCAALQLPEGLLHFANTLSDILCRHVPRLRDVVVLADVTYGACCVDDLSAAALGADFLVHYGHSCLVPVTATTLPSLYVFVHVAFDTSHLRRALLANFMRDERVALVATVQFVAAAHDMADCLREERPLLFVPQRRPLSRGELLGCTSPKLTDDADALVYVGDGRFHLESAMIANPGLRAFRYDPVAKRLTREEYALAEMHAVRKRAIAAGATAQRFGVVLGTLGRQGSPAILTRATRALRDAGKRYVVVLLSELSQAKLVALERAGVQAWVQIACPRLSIDWGEGFSAAPLLTPYELHVALGLVEWCDVYPMDYYAKDGGAWTNYFVEEGDRKAKPARSKPALRAARPPVSATPTTSIESATMTPAPSAQP